jgi:hypothetical protein
LEVMHVPSPMATVHARSFASPHSQTLLLRLQQSKVKSKIASLPQPEPFWDIAQSFLTRNNHVQDPEHADDHMYAFLSTYTCRSAAVPVSRVPTPMQAVLLDKENLSQARAGQGGFVEPPETWNLGILLDISQLL